MSLGDDTGRTRTRLPEGSGDPYGGARRNGRSSSRSLVTVVGVVVLLIAAIAFANRGGGDSDGEEGADSPKAAATAPSGEKPVSAGAAGIPAGFAHDRRGAESAAANYAVALVSADILKPARRAEIVRQVFVADKQASLEGRFDTAYSKEFLSSIGLDENGNAAPGDTYVSRTMPIGTKVTSYSDADATVDVWCSGVFGTAGEKTTNPVTSDWFTMTLQLRWADGDWKVDSFAQKDGPAPVPGDDKASTAEEMAKAVQEYGGFTYAR
ncbi:MULTISPECIES: hypothetical protein [Streptomyces]|uniref:DUF8175 domain-containing protein n=1 Tax=Streptomyces pseudogriseolus TaxID=36817 RepID=A0ABQ2T1V9_STREZ|nr:MULTISPECIES: hypothetical protein [Streptomyces]GGS49173.1 hypothetical protein GCM10010285_31100 [Streptomyces rubiginosus]